MVLKNISPKNLVKKWRFFAETTASVCKKIDHNIGY
jgi:hypothetical protein